MMATGPLSWERFDGVVKSMPMLRTVSATVASAPPVPCTIPSRKPKRTRYVDSTTGPIPMRPTVESPEVSLIGVMGKRQGPPVALDREHDLLAGALQDEAGHVGPDSHRGPVDGGDAIPLQEPRLIGGRSADHVPHHRRHRKLEALDHRRRARARHHGSWSGPRRAPR